MKNLQLSGTENVWIDEENGTIQFWSGKSGEKPYQQMVEYPIEFALKIFDFLSTHITEIENAIYQDD